MKTETILVIGACGQIGTELTIALRLKYGRNAVIASDRYSPTEILKDAGPYFRLDVMDKYELEKLVCSLKVTQIYHLAAVLSATGEQAPQQGWRVNMQGLLNVLEVAKEETLNKVFWPSSIAVFGQNSPHAACPQYTIMEPSTVYGISKCAGESWCKYYFEQYGLDVRSIRFPGLISYGTNPGGGTTDYAVDIFHQALSKGNYRCFLKENTRLPMLYMPDAIRAAVLLMDTPIEKLTVRTSYNISGMSFTPNELFKEIEQVVPGFQISYEPDFRQKIADSWPYSLDDRFARNDWGWQPEFDLKSMTIDMIAQLKIKNANKPSFDLVSNYHG